MSEKNSKLFLVPAPQKPTRTECPKCASKSVLVHHDPRKGTWFDWFTCGDCGEEWDVDEPFPVRVIGFKFTPAKG